MDLKDSIFHHFKLIKAKHKKIADFLAIWPQCGLEAMQIVHEFFHN